MVKKWNDINKFLSSRELTENKYLFSVKASVNAGSDEALNKASSARGLVYLHAILTPKYATSLISFYYLFNPATPRF